ncbi:Protein of unknown function DUF3419 [Desulfovibrio sp. X2]|uniref:DUF3419 family protein n=1 Tax=Desulfovibrio sp. X2 TaxID=941449 RepID=UPI000358D3A3|nr:BtaA family protein [Desulfovibrio sp. X2]EPR44378.1 Protein of unknown function DUF3419 [Desulfovibrio sp. X2]
MRDALHDKLFELIHGRRLIYNACWEDPALDRRLLGLDASSEVVVITSAGCNALDYLLDGPRAVCCVDVNFRQNALLELKRALIATGRHDWLWSLFGQGADAGHKAIYAAVRPRLPGYAQEFWDAKIGWFSPSGRGSFYWRAAAGDVAWGVSRILWRLKPGLRALALELLEAKSEAEQTAIYDRIEPRLWDPLLSFAVRQPFVMALLGVPRPQIEIIRREHPGGLASFVRDRLRHVLTRVPIGQNYFWRVYLTGSYSPGCCPNYLKPEHFETLRERVDALSAFTGTLSGFLASSRRRFSHFVLLDHQDWMARHRPHDLREEWRLILAWARPGARVLMRSAGSDAGFIPAEARTRLAFRPELTGPLHEADRVGTYGSQHLAVVG